MLDLLILNWLDHLLHMAAQLIGRYVRLNFVILNVGLGLEGCKLILVVERLDLVSWSTGFSTWQLGLVTRHDTELQHFIRRVLVVVDESDILFVGNPIQRRRVEDGELTSI